MKLNSHYTFSGFITDLAENQIFVFGSNPEGAHGGGTALIAQTQFGAILGQGRGIQGQSYGLVTKNLKAGYFEEVSKILYHKAGMQSVSSDQIIQNIDELYEYAKANADKEFLIAYTADGTNLNGYTGIEMAFMFAAKDIPDNIIFEEKFFKYVVYRQVVQSNI